MLSDVNKLFCFQRFFDNAQQCFAFAPQANFPAHNLNFHWRDGIQATLKKNLLYVKSENQSQKEKYVFLSNGKKFQIFKNWKVECMDFAYLFDDGTKFKIPSEKSSPLNTPWSTTVMSNKKTVIFLSMSSIISLSIILKTPLQDVNNTCIWKLPISNFRFWYHNYFKCQCGVAKLQVF